MLTWLIGAGALLIPRDGTWLNYLFAFLHAGSAVSIITGMAAAWRMYLRLLAQAYLVPFRSCPYPGLDVLLGLFCMILIAIIMLVFMPAVCVLQLEQYAQQIRAFEEYSCTKEYNSQFTNDTTRRFN